jgi:hypothetical protein
MTNNSIKEKRQTNTKWGHSKNLSIIQKKICNMLKRTKKSGPTLSMHNFHLSREKKTKWAYMEPIRLYFNICKHILRSFYVKMKTKAKKWCYKSLIIVLQPTTKIEAYPKGAHCILMLTLQICSTSVSRSLNYSL